MRRIIIGTGEILSLIIPLSVVTVIAVVIAVAPCVMFAAFTGLIPMMAAVKCGILIGLLMACGILTAIVNHYRHCDSGGCRRAAFKARRKRKQLAWKAIKPR